MTNEAHDRDRALAPSGAGAAAQTARQVSASGATPTLALVSPALRTRATWEAMAPAWPQCAMRLEPQLYEAAAERVADLIAAALQAHPGADLCVIGHNPSLHVLSMALARQNGVEDRRNADLLFARFTPASAAMFSRPADDDRLKAMKLHRFLPAT